MKKLLLLLPIALMAFSFSASAANIQCGITAIGFSTWSANGFICDIGDKTFSNFAPGTIGNNTSVQFGQGPAGFTVNFQDTTTGAFNNSFTVGYTIDVIANTAPNILPSIYKIVSVGAGLQDSGTVGGNATLVKTITGGATGTASATDVNGTTSKTAINGIQATHLVVTDTFTYSNGLITNISNTFVQADVSTPEPFTMSLMGAGLLAVGLLRRRVAR